MHRWELGARAGILASHFEMRGLGLAVFGASDYEMRVAGEVPRSETVNFNACIIQVPWYSEYVLENRLETFSKENSCDFSNAQS